ncbi:hypothetical protein Pan97_21260 [Bremerella volcania]|uniref:Uncharacterized protein n=1 Tax=Bremerella volcania TaxID=2527984 RepID=A0A518C7C2_9BACT|nr:hypothetical protein [Bremerella volcania]QDU75104.1 hypothetical protein Pan97_21260 [Bremerella volcania]
MQRYENYSDELTDHEQELGFKRVLTVNPRFGFAGRANMVPAVVLRIGPSHRIIKLVNPDGNIEYSHQAFGSYFPPGNIDYNDDEWNPVLTPMPSAESAIRMALAGPMPNNPFRQHVYTATAMMKLMCPGCSEWFDLEAESLSIGETQVCPKCEYSGVAESFVG